MSCSLTANGVDGKLALVSCSAEFRKDLLDSLPCGNGALIGKTHTNGLLGFDCDGIEDDFVLAALDIEHIQQIFHANVMGRERRRIIARELRSGARHRTDWVSI